MTSGISFYSRDNTPHLGFVHIPKCGGTSIKAVAELRFPKNFQLKTGVPHQGGSHCFSIEHEGILPQFVFLRNPVDRCFSYMNMAHRIEKNPFHKIFKRCENYGGKGSLLNQDCSCVDIFLDECFEMSNAMCQYLGADLPRLEELSEALPRKRERIRILAAGDRKRIQSGYPINMNDSIYERAIERLNNFFYIGIHDDFDFHLNAFFDKVSNTYGIQQQSIPPNDLWRAHSNVALYDPIGKVLSEKIIERNTYDIRLYEHVKKIYKDINKRKINVNQI